MRFLIDTNVVIAAEPTAAGHAEPGTSAAAELIGAARTEGHAICLHPRSLEELGGDLDAKRRQLRQILARKYPALPRPPLIPARFEQVLGQVAPRSHDEADRILLAALVAESVDYLVTEDRRLLGVAKRLGLRERALTAEEALALIRALAPRPAVPPSPVALGYAHEIAADDPILDSLRTEYDGFDTWLVRCKREQRPILQVRADSGRLAAVCILKENERPGEHGLNGRLVKISTFKVSEQVRGFRYGELLLKAFFRWAEARRVDWTFVEVFEHHADTIELFEEFGFEPLRDRTQRDELVLAKPLQPRPDEGQELEALAYHIRFGPEHFRMEAVSVFLVPIRPRFHALLFPEAEEQESFLTGRYPFGNSIRKAYLCHAALREIEPGSLLLFYRSGAGSGLRCVGVAEGAERFSDANHLARYVGSRTVYPLEEIELMVAQPTLAIVFRHARVLAEPISLAALRRGGVLKAAPQAIMRVGEAGKAWLRKKLTPSS